MKIDFGKMNGLAPAIIQDAATGKVLMLGFMNEEAYQKTMETGKVTFFSRTRNALWTKGETSDEINRSGLRFLQQLDILIAERKANMPEDSYTTALFKKGLKKISQKVGEEATEVVIDAMTKNKDRLLEESADLIYHLLVMLNYFDLKFEDVVDVLEKRHK